jgi:hypothetical protein
VIVDIGCGDNVTVDIGCGDSVTEWISALGIV